MSGDFNSWVGIEQDFVNENKTDLKYLPESYELHIIKSSRNNLDNWVNDYRKQSLNLVL